MRELSPKHMQHSRGPWEIVPTVHSDRYNIFATDPIYSYHIGTLISGSRRGLIQLRANLRLIAASPDLFAALRLALDYFEAQEDDPCAHHRATVARRAIAKVIGETLAKVEAGDATGGVA